MFWHRWWGIKMSNQIIAQKRAGQRSAAISSVWCKPEFSSSLSVSQDPTFESSFLCKELEWRSRYLCSKEAWFGSSFGVWTKIYLSGNLLSMEEACTCTRDDCGACAFVRMVHMHVWRWCWCMFEDTVYACMCSDDNPWLSCRLSRMDFVKMVHSVLGPASGWGAPDLYFLALLESILSRIWFLFLARQESEREIHDLDRFCICHESYSQNDELSCCRGQPRLHLILR